MIIILAACWKKSTLTNRYRYTKWRPSSVVSSTEQSVVDTHSTFKILCMCVCGLRTASSTKMGTNCVSLGATPTHRYVSGLFWFIIRPAKVWRQSLHSSIHQAAWFVVSFMFVNHKQCGTSYVPEIEVWVILIVMIALANTHNNRRILLKINSIKPFCFPLICGAMSLH